MEARQLFAIDGLFCGGCARGLESRLSRLDGVAAAGVHFVTASAFVRWDPARCDPARIGACIEGAGYRVVSQKSLKETADRLREGARGVAVRLSVAVFFGMWTMAAALVVYLQPPQANVARALAFAEGCLSIPVLCAGGRIFDMAARSIRMSTPGVDAATAIGAIGAVLLSLASLGRGGSQVYFDAATMLITFRLLGQLVELKLRGDAVEALRLLDNLTPETARLKASGAVVHIQTLMPDDLVTIDAGEVVTVDGVIEEGSSAVDAAILNGESTPRRIETGDRVQAGATNLERRIIVRLDRAFGDRDIDRMGGRVALEIAGRGECQTADERLARWLVAGAPAFMAIAALLGYATGSLAVAAERALATAMVICPCGLAIARPLAQLRCVARAAKSGIRISNPKAADALVAARTVIFDKTGTLTSDRLAVSDILPEPGVSSQAVLAAASAAEASIRHPVAEAIIRASGEPGAASGIRLDRGALGHWEGQSVSVRASEMSVSDGRTWVDVLVDERLTGRIALSATIDTTAPHTIGRLRRAGIHVGCATGDNESAARMVAEAVGLQPSDVASACSPVDKADRVRRSMRPVVFIGDGVNDAPALAAADCGIVVAGAHRAAAVTADIVLVEGSIDRLLTAQAAARHMRAVTRVGLVLAAAYNAVTIPAAILGFLSPVAAAAAMTASSVLVLVNAARA